MKLTSRLIEGSYTEANEIQKIVARGDVVITKQEIRATGQTAVYDAVGGVVTLTDNPQVQQGESVLVADRIKIYLKEDRSQAEGNVRVTFVKATPTADTTGSGAPAQSLGGAINAATSSAPTDSKKSTDGAPEGLGAKD
jgi:lipopolysaccharide export system protein LptA